MVGVALEMEGVELEDVLISSLIRDFMKVVM
jgi:hypothetical protein